MTLRRLCTTLLSVLAGSIALAGQTTPDLIGQIAEVMSEGASGKAHLRYIHAKGIVCTGSFEASPARRRFHEPLTLRGEQYL